MGISDLAGFSEPLKKFIEVVSNGIGALYGPYLIRRNADSKAYEIRAIASAVGESQKLIGKIEYDNNGLVLTSGNVTIDSEKDSTLNVYARATSRLNYQQIKKQINLEQIISLAADELSNETIVSEEPVDDDWISRFFNLAEDVNSKEMKILWAKILAGEVKKPKSYSLRTMELLKNISIKEAGLFSKVSQFAISCINKAFLPRIASFNEFGIEYSDLLLLEELNLITGIESNIKYTSHDKTLSFINSGLFLVVERNDTTELNIGSIPFTRLGVELLALVEVLPANINYLKKFASIFLKEGEVLKYGTILSKNDDESFKCSALVDL